MPFFRRRTAAPAPAPATDVMKIKQQQQAQANAMTPTQVAAAKGSMEQMANTMANTMATKQAQQAQANAMTPSQISAAKSGMEQMAKPPVGGGTPSGGFKKGGKVKSKSTAHYSSGGSASKASSRADGIAQRGKTKGRMI